MAKVVRPPVAPPPRQIRDDEDGPLNRAQRRSRASRRFAAIATKAALEVGMVVKRGRPRGSKGGAGGAV